MKLLNQPIMVSTFELKHQSVSYSSIIIPKIIASSKAALFRQQRLSVYINRPKKRKFLTISWLLMGKKSALSFENKIRSKFNRFNSNTYAAVWSIMLNPLVLGSER